MPSDMDKIVVFLTGSWTKIEVCRLIKSPQLPLSGFSIMSIIISPTLDTLRLLDFYRHMKKV